MVQFIHYLSRGMYGTLVRALILLRLRRCINHLLTYLLTYLMFCLFFIMLFFVCVYVCFMF